MGLCSLMRLKPSQRRTRGQGVDQSTILLGGGTRRGHQEAQEIGKKSVIVIVTVSYTLATRCHSQSTLALGVWGVTHCHSCHPSISIPFILHPHTNALSLIVISFRVCRGDHSHVLFITAPRPRHSHQSSHAGYGPRLWDVLFSIPVRLVQPLVEGHVPAASL